MFTISRVNGIYEGSSKYFNFETLKHEPIYTIEKTENGYVTYKKGSEIEIHKKLNDAKQSLEKIAYSPIVFDEIEQGFADGGGNSGGVCITGDGNGFAWHKDENGNIISE